MKICLTARLKHYISIVSCIWQLYNSFKSWLWNLNLHIWICEWVQGIQCGMILCCGFRLQVGVKSGNGNVACNWQRKYACRKLTAGVTLTRPLAANQLATCHMPGLSISTGNHTTVLCGLGHAHWHQHEQHEQHPRQEQREPINAKPHAKQSKSKITKLTMD